MLENVFRPAFWEGDLYKVLDQIALPEQKIFLEATTMKDVYLAIKEMKLRGAPLIGAAASAGIAFAAREWDEVSMDNFERDYTYLLGSRPTAVNLRNVLDEVRPIVEASLDLTPDELYAVLRKFSIEVHDRDIERNIKIGEAGADYIEKMTGGRKLRISTHCNAGTLATGGYGTALGVIYSLHRRGLVEMVWVDETRPYLQGSRLTAYELGEAGVPHTVITDSTTAWIMKRGEIDVVVIGADRLSANGDFANKIGSYSLAVNAHYHKIPFFTALPLETFDLAIESGDDIVIEERSEEELFMINGRRISPGSSRGLHLGFDVVPADLLTGIVTEFGVIDGSISKESVARFLESCAGSDSGHSS